MLATLVKLAARREADHDPASPAISGLPTTVKGDPIPGTESGLSEALGKIEHP